VQSESESVGKISRCIFTCLFETSFEAAPWFYFCENAGATATVPGGLVGFFILEIDDSAVQVGYFTLEIAASAVQVGFFILEIDDSAAQVVCFLFEITASAVQVGFFLCEISDPGSVNFFFDADSLAEGCDEREEGDLVHNFWLI